MTRLSASDLRGAFRLVGVVGEADTRESFRGLLLSEVEELIPCDLWVSISELSWEHSKVLVHHVGARAPATPKDESDFWSLLPRNPLFRYRVDSHDSRALKMSDFLTQREFHRSKLYAEGFRPHGVEYQLEVQLPPTVEAETVLVLNRGNGRDFSERDRALLDIVKPHLARLYELVRFREHAAGDAETMRRLTKRELAVLSLAAEGRSNQEIAAALTVAEGTVRKHLDNIYAKLEVHNRTAAIRCLGLTASPCAAPIQ